MKRSESDERTEADVKRIEADRQGWHVQFLVVTIVALNQKKVDQKKSRSFLGVF